ncbi:unnamed protein product [Effrenium voratum]|uniref:Uncharacterized protein n=1 Tax=Effrenium voratum TaxID=2562239 RepID=A0AA36IVC7_9DINO|nr:unnamed protein product [Effrenium voratum]CAJ1413987.1 unnamed protein product [Effrenium voratum]
MRVCCGCLLFSLSSLIFAGQWSRGDYLLRFLGLRFGQWAWVELGRTPLTLGENCPAESADSFHSGWEHECTWQPHNQLDETCELFLASEMYRNASHFLRVATRADDPKVRPSFLRLRARLAQATLEKRPFKILAMGPSTTAGVGCMNHGRRWIDDLPWLANASNNTPLRLQMIDGTKRATTFTDVWSQIFHAKIAENPDLIILDYTVTGDDFLNDNHQVVVMSQAVDQLPKPPAIISFESFRGRTILMLKDDLEPEQRDACQLARNLERMDPFFGVAKQLQLPILSLPDILCALPQFNRTGRKSKSSNNVPWLFSYPNEAPHHYGCGVHHIMAEAIFQLLSRHLAAACHADYQKILAQSQARDEELRMQRAELSREDRCRMQFQTFLSYYSAEGFRSYRGPNSSWQFGADRPTKFGWIANWDPEPGQLSDPYELRTKHRPMQRLEQYDHLPPEDIVFLLKFSVGVAFVEYLSTYQNIGSAFCQIEDLSGKLLSERHHIQAKWTRRVSLSNQLAIYLPELTKAQQAVLRCTSEGQKFKLLSVSSC